MTVLLRHFPLNRQLISMQVSLPLSLALSNGVLIEPGAQWYKGGNVTIFLLFHNLLLLVFSRRTQVLFGICWDNYVSLLLVVHSFHSRLLVFWFIPHRSWLLLEGTGWFYICYLVVMDFTSTGRFSYINHIVPFYSSFHDLLPSSMMTHPSSYIVTCLYSISLHKFYAIQHNFCAS